MITVLAAYIAEPLVAVAFTTFAPPWMVRSERRVPVHSRTTSPVARSTAWDCSSLSSTRRYCCAGRVLG